MGGTDVMRCDDEDPTIEDYHSGRQGDVWKQRWERTTGTRSYDLGTLLVQIRRSDGTLVASSGADGAVEGVIPIVTTGSNFTSDPIVWTWKTTGDTAGVDPNGVYVLEAQCEIDGDVTTFHSHAWHVLPQHAYPEAA
jgi:hypothetical protein